MALHTALWNLARGGTGPTISDRLLSVCIAVALRFAERGRVAVTNPTPGALMNLRLAAGGVVVAIVALIGLRPIGPWIAAEEFAARRTRMEPARSRHADEVRRFGFARAFWGVDATGDPDASCAALRGALSSVRPDQPPQIASHLELMRYLEDAQPPSLEGAPLWRATLPAVERTRRFLLMRTEPVTMATLLQVTTREAGGAMMGVLTAHNLVKELTLAGRRQPPDQVREPEARLAQALSPWRRVPSLPAGGYDRLGPIYHVLAALTLVSWTGSPTLGALAADYEALRRIARVGRDRPDPEKARADRCGVEAAAEWLARSRGQ